MIPVFIWLAYDEKENVRYVIAQFLNGATESHYMAMVEDIVTNGGVEAIYSLFSSENVPQIQIEALISLENIMRTTEITDAKRSWIQHGRQSQLLALT